LPTLTGGNSYGLSLAERKIGLDSKVLSIDNCGWLKYQTDFNLNIDSGNYFGMLLGEFKKIRAFLKIRKKYDIYHFNFGSSLIDIARFGIFLWDVPFYNKSSKIFVTYNGCDARQKYPTMERTRIAPCHNPNCYGGMCNSGKRDLRRKRKIEKFSKYALHMFAVNPDLLWFLPKEQSSFLPYTISNWDDIKKKENNFEKKKIKIIHAPTNKAAKGSDYILKALNNIQTKFPNLIDIVLVEKQEHKKALEIYSTADLIIDQVLAGWYGGFAVEVMKMGKPVMVYIRDEDLVFIPDDMKKDVYSSFLLTDIYTIEDKLLEIIFDRVLLKQIAESAYDFVWKWHNPLRIAKYLKENFYDM